MNSPPSWKKVLHGSHSGKSGEHGHNVILVILCQKAFPKVEIVIQQIIEGINKSRPTYSVVPSSSFGGDWEMYHS